MCNSVLRRISISNLSIAILIPCYNEEVAIGKVIKDFKAELPHASIYIYDNASKDNTVIEAKRAGALIGHENLPGKGNVVRRMFSDIEADIYILVDGDDTYDASSSSKLIKKLIDNKLDMVTGARVTKIKEAYRPGHRFGNLVITGFVQFIFGNRIKDMLSGYRVFSRRFVKSFPALSEGFEIETELTVHALELRMPIDEIEIHYKDRPEGSDSKLRTLHDGFRILKTIALLIKEERPFILFFTIFCVLSLLSIVIAYPVITEFMQTGLVPRFPSAILATGMMLLAFLSLTCGLILSSGTHGRREMKRLYYLSIPWTQKNIS